MTSAPERTTYAIDDASADLLFRHARTANKFTDAPVTEDELRAIYELVKWAPTAMNGQPFRIVVVASEDAKARLQTHLREPNRAKTASAPLTVIIALDTEFHENLPALFPHFPGAKNMFADTDPRHNVAKAQTWLQTGYFILGVRALGLAAGPMTGFDSAGVDADLLAGTNLQSVVVINIGHPDHDATFDRLPRLSYEDVVTTI